MNLVFRHPLWLFVLILAVAAAGCAPAAPTPPAPPPAAPTTAPTEKAAAAPAATPGPAQIALYKGPDRDKIILEGANKEGSVMIYTSFVVDQILQPLTNAWQKKYPNVKLNFYRASSADIPLRIESEYAAKRYEVDVVNDTNLSPAVLQARGQLQPFYSKFGDDYPADADAGRHPDGYWIHDLRYPRAFVYNTKLVKKEEVIKNWEDLLAPRWKGRFAWTDLSTGSQLLIGGLLDTWGKERTMDFLTKLSKQDVATLSVSIRGIADQVIAGQYDAGFGSVHHVEISKADGAPIDWVAPGDTVFESSDTVNLMKNPAHPFAAMLWIDFVLDPDGGQKVFQDARYLPRHPKLAKDVPALVGKKEWVITPKRIEQDSNEWARILKELFLGR